MTIFRSNYFHLKSSFFKKILNIRYIYANAFKIFKFELNPLGNKKDISLYVLFRTFQVNFQDISVTPIICRFLINSILLLFYIFLSHGNEKRGGCCVLSTSTCDLGNIFWMVTRHALKYTM